MDWTNIYNELVKRASSRKRGDGVFEAHHIKPKCCDGSDDPSNLVLLTFREHYLAHMLLVKMHPDNAKLATALWFMSISTMKTIHKFKDKIDLDNRLRNRFESLRECKKKVISSHAYSFARNEYTKHMFGHRVEESTKSLISASTKSSMCSKEIIQKCSSGSAGARFYYDKDTLKLHKRFPGDPEIDLEKFMYGRPPMTDEQRKKLSNVHKIQHRVMMHNDEFEINLPMYLDIVDKIPQGWVEKSKSYKNGAKFKKFLKNLKNKLLDSNIFFNHVFCYTPLSISKKKKILNPMFFEIFSDFLKTWQEDQDKALNQIVDFTLENYDFVEKKCHGNLKTID